MKIKQLAKSLVLLVFIISSHLLFSSCTGDGKTVPVYQGISISQNTAVALKPAQLLSNSEKSDADIYENISGDFAERNEMLDEENPFGKPDSKKALYDAAKEALQINTETKDIYYAAPNEDIYINIHIDNPDNFEILSFTLNGSVYSSYMFEDGSDMQTLILKYNVGSLGGIKEYTVDAIKYIDGTSIKDVRMDGERTVLAAVNSGTAVSCEIQASEIGTTSIGFNVAVNDVCGLIPFFDTIPKALIYDGEKIVAAKDLAIGENSISFDGLNKSTLYQCAVVAFFDDLSGNGADINILNSVAFYTESNLLFDNITITQDSVCFDLKWNDSLEVGTVEKLSLFLDGELVAQSEGVQSFDGLLSDKCYTVVAEYSHSMGTDKIQLNAKTLKKQSPSIQITSITLDSKKASADYKLTDPDQVTSSIKAAIYKNGILIEKRDDGKIEFGSLDSYTQYKIYVELTYDLNDGAGERTISAEKEFRSSPVIEPISFEVINTDSPLTSGTVCVRVNAANPSKAEIYALLISGKVYNLIDVCSDSTATIEVQIPVDEQFEAGDNILVLEKIYSHLNFVRYDISVGEGFCQTVNIPANQDPSPSPLS